MFNSFGASSVRFISWSHSHLSGNFSNFFLLNKCVKGQMYSGKSSGFVLSGSFLISPLSCSLLSVVSVALVLLDLNHMFLCFIVQFLRHLVNLIIPFFQLISRLCLTSQSCSRNMSVLPKSIIAASRVSLYLLILTSRGAILVISPFFVPLALNTSKEKFIGLV